MKDSEKRQQIASIEKSLTEAGMIIEAGWASLRAVAIDTNASDVQLAAMRMSFFAGAAHLFSSIMKILDPGDEPTEGDIRRLDLIQKELDDFARDFNLRHTQVQGRA